MSIICQNCKSELPDGSVFCNKCGNNISAVQTTIQNNAPYYNGGEIPTTYNFEYCETDKLLPFSPATTKYVVVNLYQNYLVIIETYMSKETGKEEKNMTTINYSDIKAVAFSRGLGMKNILGKPFKAFFGYYFLMAMCPWAIVGVTAAFDLVWLSVISFLLTLLFFSYFILAIRYVLSEIKIATDNEIFFIRGKNNTIIQLQALLRFLNEKTMMFRRN